MPEKPYYSVRTGKNPLSERFDLSTLLDLFRTLFIHFEDEGYFQEALGYDCVDAGFVPGTHGHDLNGALLLELRKSDLTPIRSKINNYSEDDLFDIIEFLYEHCSKPIKRYYHSWSDCGWHCETFDRELGRQEYQAKANRVLALYGPGYELSADGEILGLADTGLEDLFKAPLPSVDPANISSRIEAARNKFRRYKSTLDERRDAIRDLADVLEYLRPQLKDVIASKDESDLFNLANNFGIRHHNSMQKTKYDKPIWYSWMFYYYLATIHAIIRLIERNRSSEPLGEEFD
ncbi:MAG: hypothetical protein GQ565_06295 [Candidatus Aegiribacteria sp.]|nr:hypothetical protein [Candidatus Aegiribacteria sp.]